MTSTRLALCICLAGAGAAAPAGAWRYEAPGLVEILTVDVAGDVIAGGRVYNPSVNPVIAVRKIDGTNGAELWSTEVDFATAYSFIHAVVTDASGDVIVAGEHIQRFFVIKLAGATGLELWRYEITYGSAMGVALFGGDVIAAGGTRSGIFDPADMTVVRLAGATGAELWRSDVDGTDAPSGDFAWAMAVDGSGDVVAAGELKDIGAYGFAVVKFDGTDGTELWRTVQTSGTARHVAVDAAGNAIAVQGGTARKFDGANGMVLWTYLSPGSCGSNVYSSLALDSAGDAVLGCDLSEPGPSERQFWVVKIANGSGTEVWRHLSGGPGPDSVSEVAVDASDDVVAVGYRTEHGVDSDWAIVRLAGADGAEVWRQRVDGTFRPEGDTSEGVRAVAVLPSGDFAVSGYLIDGLGQGYPTYAVLSVSALDGATGPVRGGQLVVKDAAGNPSARRLIVSTKDVSFVTPPPGSIGDPTANGGTLTLTNPTTLETATLSLPAGAAWTGLGSPPGAKGYRYRDAGGANGPCKSVIAKPGRMKALCLGSIGTIPFSLDEPTQGSLVTSLQLGTAEAQCARFGGSVQRDQGTANPGPAGSFKATKAPPFAGACP